MRTLDANRQWQRQRVVTPGLPRRRATIALGVVFEGLRNTLEPRVTLSFSSVCRGLWALTQELRRQLRADHEAAAVLCLKLQGASSYKMGMLSFKELREAK